MKTRLVLWGTDTENRKVLLALALRTEDSKVDIWAFPEEVATESFYQRMIDDWRLGREVAFPEVFTQYDVPFTSTSELLPDGLTADRGDLMQQAQTEWQFVVLSSRLYKSYRDELNFFRDKLERLDNFDNKLWEELKGYWEKVQRHIHDRVLFREHGMLLREQTNAMFEQLKSLRRSLDAEFKSSSRAHVERFMQTLTGIEERIREDRGLQPIFEELKRLQNEYRDTRFTRDDRNKVWQKLDAVFKSVKERRFGPEARKPAATVSRTERRLEGLISAIEKMEKSIAHDQRDIAFEEERIAGSHGQLEAQIRQAKLVMIQERIRSKQEKLTDMQNTRAELEKRIERDNKREEARKAKAEKERLRGEVESTLKEQIAEEIRHNVESHAEEAERLEKAAEEIAESRRKTRSKKSDAPAAKDSAPAGNKTHADVQSGSAEDPSDLVTENIIESSSSPEGES